jgi:hypothetical protein
VVTWMRTRVRDALRNMICRQKCQCENQVYEADGPDEGKLPTLRPPCSRVEDLSRRAAVRVDQEHHLLFALALPASSFPSAPAPGGTRVVDQASRPAIENGSVRYAVCLSAQRKRAAAHGEAHVSRAQELHARVCGENGGGGRGGEGERSVRARRTLEPEARTSKR